MKAFTFLSISQKAGLSLTNNGLLVAEDRESALLKCMAIHEELHNAVPLVLVDVKEVSKETLQSMSNELE